jgi:4-amino-4-deoxy-L-arabinose transferase-like glycosyltransferase
LPRQSTRFFTILAAIVAGGLLLRIVFVIAYAPADIPIDDGLWYHGAANLLVEGRGFIDPFVYVFVGQSRQSAGHPPLWPLVLTPVSWFGGTSVFAHQVTQAVVGGLAVFAVGGLGREMAGDRAGLIAGGIAAVYPAFWVTTGDLYSESLYTLVVASMLWAAYRFLRRPSMSAAVTLGATSALAALCRGEALLFLPVLVVPAVLFARPPELRRPRMLGVAILAAVVVLAPWTIFNLTRFAEPVPVSTSFGFVIAGSNCPSTYGAQLGSWNVACSARKVRGDDSQRSAELRRIGTTYATNHLGRLPVVLAARLGRTYELYVVDPHVYGPSWLKIVTTGAWYAVFLIAIAGAFVLRRRGTSLIPVIATVIVVTVTVMLTWGSPRFRVPVDIVAIALAAVAVDHWSSRARSNSSPTPVIPR